MESDFLEQQRYLKVKKRVKRIKGFYTHLSIYCIVIPTLIFINLKYEPYFHWYWFSLIGWGIGLLSHWINVFGLKLLGLENKWEERKIKEFMNDKSK